ncbi:MAG: hypothetical protein AAF682_30360, partial [Planctomycetota bacterium]
MKLEVRSSVLGAAFGALAVLALAFQMPTGSSPTTALWSHCSAPPRSSHVLRLLLTKLAGRQIAQRLMRPAVVVPVDPPRDGPPGLL